MFLDVWALEIHFFDEDAGMAAQDYLCSLSHGCRLQCSTSASPPAVSSESPVERGQGGAWRSMEEEVRDSPGKRNIYCHWFH